MSTFERKEMPSYGPARHLQTDKNVGYFFQLVGIVGFGTLTTALMDVEYLLEVWIFVGSLSMFHLYIGLGLVVKNRRAFYFFVYYIKLFSFAYPLWTYLSRQTLSYSETNNIFSMWWWSLIVADAAIGIGCTEGYMIYS